ncbi:hypothetical protein [Aquimarina mytili]|uniref:HTH domain-containing protein n=1 Tax=Aquimarina mytili TaxID=874423 RepID=A0A936ZTK9_9FLAO|nr:hypothetical protein [Aquimarina mytili]MBL0685334.1 hypothetical protein [Aquimarina mytili]
MNIIIKQIELIQRIDRLIRMQATGPAEDLSYRLGVSKTKLYRTINVMKELDAPIVYDFKAQSFVYEKAVGFRVGFFDKKQVSA